MDTVRHDINCLQDARIDTRWKALQRVRQNFDTTDEDEVKALYAGEIVKPLLRMFDDKRDRHREHAASLVKDLVKHMQYDCMEWILPVVVARLGGQPVVEQAEPVKLELVELIVECLNVFPHDIHRRGFLDYFASILKNCMKDADPDMKLAVCRGVAALTDACRENTKAVAMDMAKALKPNLRVKQWKVRRASMKAFGQLVCNGALDIIYDFRDEVNEINTTRSILKALCCDRSESVRQAALDVIADWTMEISERQDMHRHFVPFVCLAMTDAIESVRMKAIEILKGLGKFYEMDNEDNRVDLESRRITLKDIKWYADEVYPDMGMNVKTSLPGMADLDQRPPIGIRMAVAECCRTFIPPLLSDIIALEWNIPNSLVNRRMAGMRILIVTCWIIESNALQYMQAILDALYKVLRDDDPVVRNEAFFCLELLGKFHTPDNYIPLVLTQREGGSMGVEEKENEDEVERREVCRRNMTIFTTTANTTKVNILIAFKYLLIGTPQLTEGQAYMITQAITSQEVVDPDAPQQLLALLDLIAVFQSLLLKYNLIHKYTDIERELDDGAVEAAKSQHPFDFYLFFTLMDIQACVDVDVLKKSKAVLTDLSTMLTGSADGLYMKHFLRAIRDVNSVPLPVLSNLLTYGGPMLAKYTVNIVQVFLAHLHECRYDVDARDQLRCMDLLVDFVLKVKTNKVVIPMEQIEQIIVLIIVPNGKWHAGGAAHLFRKVALSLLSALLVQGLIPTKLFVPDVDEGNTWEEKEAARKILEEGANLLTSVVDTWKNTLDADDPELRAIVVKTSLYIMSLPLQIPESQDCMKELMLRMDDSNDLVRIEAAYAFKQIFGIYGTTLSANVKESFTTDKVKSWVATLLLHMDDANQEVKEAVCEALQAVKADFKDIVAELAAKVREKHMTTRYIDRLLADDAATMR